jgi:TonB family protein
MFGTSQDMRSRVAIIFLLTTSLILIAPAALNSADIIIHVHLFRGEWTEAGFGLKEATLLTAASHPEINALKAKLDAPENELTVAAIDALIETQDLKTVDEYFAHAEKWTGRAGVFSRDIEHKLYRFKFVYIPRRLSPERIELKVALYKSEEAKMDKLLDTRLLLDLDTPVIVGMPSGEETFYLLIYVREERERPAAGSREATKPETEEKPSLELPKEVHTLIPAYPEELRQQGIQGQVALQVTIDEKGNVIGVKVAKSLHPYLDFAAVQAVRQWKYEPAVRDGQPIPVTVRLVMNFDPASYRNVEKKAKARAYPSEGRELGSGNALEKILEESAAYCRKLTGASLDFICEERIKEVHYNFATEPKWAGISVASKETGRIVKESWFPQWDPMRTVKSDYLCDYLFVRKGDRLEERRIILKDNGRRMPDRSRLLGEKRFTALNPVLAAVELLDRDRQTLYNFRLIDTEGIKGKKAHIIEAIPKAGNTLGVEYAKIWIDQASAQVVRSEIQGVPLEGYDDVLIDAVQFRVRPYFLTTHTYDFEKNGVRFPSRTTIRVEYPRRGDFYKDRTLKLKIDMTYDKYQFFTVETEESIKK